MIQLAEYYPLMLTRGIAVKEPMGALEVIVG